MTARLRSAARVRWLLALALLGGGVALAWALDRHGIALADPEVLADQVRATGALASVLLVALLLLQSVVAPLPSQPVLMAAGFVYGPWVGFVIGWIGVLFGACACFAIARILGRPVALRFVREERIAAVDAYVSERGLRSAFVAILSLRLFAHFSFDVTSYACGVVRFPFGWFVLATALGEVPKVLLFTTLGAGLGEVPGWLGLGIALGAIASIGAIILLTRKASATV